MITVDASRTEEQRDRVVALLKKLIADKRADEEKAIAAYQNDPELQEIIASLLQENTTRGPINKL